MDLTVTIENYRCFPTGRPAALKLKEGFSALIGVNNVGKSSLLKFFYELRPVLRMLGEVQVLQQVFGGGKPQALPPPEVLDRNEMFFNGNKDDMRVEVNLGGIPQQPNNIITRAAICIERESAAFSETFFTVGGTEITQSKWQHAAFGGPHWVDDTLRGTGTGNPIVADFQHLRSAFRLLADAYYVPAFRHISALAPLQSGPQTYYDINVGRPFIETWHGLQTGVLKQGREQIYRLVNEIKDNFGFKQLEISASSNQQSLQLMIDGRPFALQEIGAGIAQFIVVLGNAAFRAPSFILIDEPEISLHPTLQLKFLTKLSDYASEGVVFATHNIGLARSVAEEIYSVTSDDRGTQINPIGDTPRLAELLGELNYEGFRPLGFNKILLVEGRTGVKTFIELLKLFNKEHEFLVVPMSDLINRYSTEELQEVTRICPHTFAVIDSEKENPADPIQAGRELFKQNCEGLGIDCHILERRAIENYLPDRAIKRSQGANFRGLGPHEGRTGLVLWPKTENWRVARVTERREVEGTDLGAFLARI